MQFVNILKENENDFDEVKFVRCILPVRYDEDDIPYDFPLRKGNIFDITISVEDGTILNFPLDVKKHINMKVCDEGSYELLDLNKEIIAAIYQTYVPDSYTIPGEWGDYVDFKISNGKITNWYNKQKRTYYEFTEKYKYN